MKTIININDREALPVRAIPYVTGWTISPDGIAEKLALTSAMGFQVDSYLLNGDGSYSGILAKEWDGCSANLKALSKKIKGSQESEEEGYERWRQESISAIPSATFVWKDEFEAAFTKAYSKYRLTILDERTGDRQLNFAPMLSPAMEIIIMNGFNVVEIETPREKPLSNKERETLLVIIAALAKEANIDISRKSKAATLIARLTEQIGARVGETTIETHLTKIPDALENRAK